MVGPRTCRLHGGNVVVRSKCTFGGGVANQPTERRVVGCGGAGGLRVRRRHKVATAVVTTKQRGRQPRKAVPAYVRIRRLTEPSSESVTARRMPASVATGPESVINRA